MAEDRDAPMIEIARRVVDARKVVFTTTMASSPWPDASLATGDLAEEWHEASDAGPLRRPFGRRPRPLDGGWVGSEGPSAARRPS